jgi:hypothetical protein
MSFSSHSPSSTAPSSSSAFVGTPDVVPGPRDLAALQRDTLAVMKKAPAVFVLLPALAFLPFDFVNEVVSSAVGGDDVDGALRGLRAYHRFGQWIELGVGSLVAATVLSATVAVGEGRIPTMAEALKTGAAAWGRALKTTFISGVLVGFATLLFIVPGLVYGTRYMLAVPASIVDGLDQGEARAKSTALVQERGAFRLFCWGFAAVFSWYMLSLVPTMTASLLVPSISPVADAAVNAVVAAAWNIVGAGLVVAAGLLYLELSGRTLQWPVGLALRDERGGRLTGPRGTGQLGLALVGGVAGLAALVLVPLIAVSLWFLFAPESAAAAIDGSPLLTEAFEVLFGGAGADLAIDPSLLPPAEAIDDLAPSGVAPATVD